MANKRQLWLGADISNPRWDHKKIENDPKHLYGILVPYPDWHDVENALRSMDGEMLNEVYLELSDDNALMAGGGNGGRYVVAHLPDNSGVTSFMLTDLSQQGPPVEVMVSQASEYPAEWCVDLPHVLKAFEHFFQTGQRTEDQCWEPGDYRN